jgi:hypothetical protein
MQLTGLYWGHKLLRKVEYPHAEILGPEASVDQIKDLIKRCGQVFIKPIFKGGVGKKGKAGLMEGQGPADGARGEGASLLHRA